MCRTRVRRAWCTAFPTVLKSRRQSRLARERKISGQSEPRECRKQIVREHVQSEPGGICADLPTREGCARELEDERPTGAGGDQPRIFRGIELQGQRYGRLRHHVSPSGGFTFGVT